MYIDFIDDILKKSNIIHLCKCNCKLTIPLITIGNTYISNSSNVELYLHDYSFPIIYLYDDSKIKIMSDTENCNVTIYKYSDECSVNFEKTSGKYKIERKELKI
jgi:hypothetical protein